jgi:type I restriction enzyme M protein
MSRLFVGSVVAAVRPVWSRFDARSGNGAPDVVVGGEAFRVRLEALQEELEVLNIEAPVLQARIAQNVAELLAV